MDKNLADDLKRCLEVLEQIRAQYPEGEFDREMLHGDMDFRYRRIKELRRQLASFSPGIQKFCRFVDTAGVSPSDLRACLQLISDHPDFFSVSPGQGPGTLQKMCAEASEQISVAASHMLKILARMRMNGLLDARYRLPKGNRKLVEAYLNF